MMQSLINLFCTQDDDESNLAILLYESQGLLNVPLYFAILLKYSIISIYKRSEMFLVMNGMNGRIN